MWVVCVLPEYSFVCEFFSMERVCVCITMCAWEKKKASYWMFVMAVRLAAGLQRTNMDFLNVA